MLDRKLLEAMYELANPAFVDAWLEMPNDAFGGEKPINVDEKRLWAMVHQLQSGQPQ